MARHLTKHEAAELVRLMVKAMRRQLTQKDIDWLVETRERAEMFSEAMCAT